MIMINQNCGLFPNTVININCDGQNWEPQLCWLNTSLNHDNKLYTGLLKGIVHPQMKICHHLLTLMMLQTTFLSSIKHKKRMLIKHLTVSINFHRLSLQTMEINGYQQLFGYQHYYFVFNRRKKFGTTVWSNMRVSKSWHFSFLEWTILTARETKWILLS